MKKIVALAMALSVAASQAFSYSVETLKGYERTSAAVKTAEVVVNAIVEEENKSLELVGGVAGEVNRLLTYALQDQSCVMRITRVIDGLAKNADFRKAKAFDAGFAKNFATELSHGISAEVVRFFAHKGVATGMSFVTDNRLVNRAAHALGEAVSSAVVETAFAKLSNYVNNVEDDKVEYSKELVAKFFATLVTEAAYHLAGEMILQGTEARVDYIKAVKEALNR
ncbi:hypothetical protein FJ364_05035 [Candidatus Dependentiae bacterium]|nr:hypothetical protein [Candidatus Dependentiae bacterium]